MKNRVRTIVACMCLIPSLSQGGQAMNEIRLHELDWHLTWDTRERDLSITDGASSEAELRIDKSEGIVGLSGRLGFFRASQTFGKPLVAFTIAEAKMPSLNPPIRQFCFRSVSTTPGIRARLILRDLQATEDFERTGKKGSYQAEFLTTAEETGLCLNADDFDFIVRGRSRSAPPVDLGSVHMIGLLVTRSSQLQESAITESFLPFDIQINSASFD